MRTRKLAQDLLNLVLDRQIVLGNSSVHTADVLCPPSLSLSLSLTSHLALTHSLTRSADFLYPSPVMISLSLTHIQSEFWKKFSNTENFSELLLIHFFVSPFNHTIFSFFCIIFLVFACYMGIIQADTESCRPGSVKHGHFFAI